MDSATVDGLVASLAVVAPELLIAVGAMVLLVFGVARGDRSIDLLTNLCVLLLFAAGVLLVRIPLADGPALAFAGSFIVDTFAVFMKVLVLTGSALALLMSRDFMKREQLDRFEFPLLMVLATLGMLIMISAQDLITLYVGLELQSLALYVLAAINRDSQRATEAGLKYFLLGALSSGMLLYGASLVYGFSGTTDFAALADTLQADDPQLGILVGIVFVAAGLAFKVSAVPFHMWTPDVYEGAPTPVTAFFSAAPKIAAMALFMRTFLVAFGDMVGAWQQILLFISVASMILGSFAAIGQQNLKRLMAYSSIANMGYALMGLAAGTESGVEGMLIYLVFYLAMTVGVFVCILSMRRAEGMVERIDDLAGLSKSHPYMAYTLMILMFSLIGVPPLAGFFGKWYVFLSAVEAGLVPLAVVGVLTSAVGAFYYLRIVKVMFIDEPVQPFQRPVPFEMTAILTASGATVLLYVLYPAPLLTAAQAAARSLLGG